MKLLLLALLLINTTHLIAAECPEFVTNTEAYKGKKKYICSIDRPSIWAYRDGICDQTCTGDCPDGKCCTDDTSKDISGDGGVIGKIDDKTACEKNGNKCREGESCWLISVTAEKGKAVCPCICLGVPDGKRNQANSIQNPSNSSVNTCGDLVKLDEFTAEPQNNGILLNWTTKSELNSQGFRMWRAIPELNKYCGCSGNVDDYTQIQVLDKEGKPILIPAKGSTTSGSDYSYLDKDAKPGIAYCYALEDIDFKGKSKFYFEYVAFTQDNLEESK